MMVSWDEFLQIVADEQGLVKEKQRQAFLRGRPVYLLLDAVDEMGRTSPLSHINQLFAEGWMKNLRIIVTGRLNF